MFTAGHVVLNDFDNPNAVIDRYVFGTGQNALSDPGSLYTATQIFLHPDYSGVYRSDLAILYFEDPITDETPAARYREQIDIGDLVSIAGYGKPGTPATGLEDLDFQRRGCENVFESQGRGIFPDYAPFTNPPGFTYFTNSTPLDSATTPGDSGCGWYNNAGLLVGIHAAGDGQGYHSPSVSMGIYEFNPWIDQVQAEVRGRVPEPSIFVIFATDAVTFLLLRLRRRAR